MGFSGKEILKEIEKIKSNEKGKLISLELVDFDEEIDFQDKNIFLEGDALKLAADFSEYCQNNGEKKCFIVFSTKFNLELARIILERASLKEDLLLVGAGNLSSGEIEFISENKIKKISLNQIELDLENSTDSIMEFSSGKELFVLFDFSVVDFEQGGLSARKAIYILGRMGMMKNLKLALFPSQSKEEKETKLAARLIAELF